MLNFKVGKIYKGNDGKEWRYCGYVNEMECPYYFKYMTNGNFFKFAENSNNSVVCEGTGIKILFVEEKERDWVVGEEYECYCIKTQKIIKVKLVETNNSVITEQNYRFKSNKEYHWLYGKGEVLSRECWVVFKNGVPQELKDRLNKGKLTNERKCFKKGRTYKNHNGASNKFKKRIKTQRGLLAVFEKEDGLIYFDILYKMNNIECIPFSYSSAGMFLCADESIRNGDGSKAVRVMQ